MRLKCSYIQHGTPAGFEPRILDSESEALQLGHGCPCNISRENGSFAYLKTKAQISCAVQ